jgi:PAS domain S-box-containing protein
LLQSVLNLSAQLRSHCLKAMQIQKRVLGANLPLLIVLVIGGSTTGWLAWRAAEQASIEGSLDPSLSELQLVRGESARYVVQLQSQLVSDSVAKAKGGEVARPKDAFEAYLRESSLITPASKSTTDSLRVALDVLSTTAKELTARATAKGAASDSAVAALTSPQALVARLLDLQREISGLTSRLERVHLAQRTELRAASRASSVQAWIAAGSTLLLALVAGVVGWVRIRAVVVEPIMLFARRLQAGKALPESDDELGTIATEVNKIVAAEHRLEQSLGRMAEGDFGLALSDNDFSETALGSLKRIRERVENITDRLKQNESDLTVARKNAATKEEQLKTQIGSVSENLKKLQAEAEQTRAKLNAVESTLAIAELDAEGRVIYADKAFSSLSGYTPDELKGREIATLSASPDPALYDGLRTALKAGQTWYGVFQNQTKGGGTVWLASAVTPLTNGNGAATNGSSHYLLAGYEISTLKHQESELRKNLVAVQSDLSQYQGTIDGLKGEQQRLMADFERQKHLEFRLVQQQSALQELTRNKDLKEGNVREALRSITEACSYALDADRVGLWLFTENGAVARCLDLYDRPRLLHTEGLELKKSQAPTLLARLHADTVFSSPDAQADPALAEIVKSTLEPHGIRSMLCAPIHLGGSVVGYLEIDHTGASRAWMADEQNFLFSVTDAVSLALEQGNRRVMEEELRMTLEESQALEEELRQNAEEIETTNEEMRRTQAELKGQINALNNSAIVSESNPNGIITYANNEFVKVYGYGRDEVLGQNHRMLRSDFHAPAFFAHLWQTVVSGKVWRGEVKNKDKSGNEVWVLLTVTPVLGVDGVPYKYIGVAYNITAQKTQERQIKAALEVALQQEDLLRQNADELEFANEEMRRAQIELAGQINALNNSSMVYETDMEGAITYINEELIEITSYTRDELMGKRYHILKSGRQSETIYTEQWRNVLNGKIWKGELELRDAAGKYFWAVVTCTPVLDESGDPIKSINVLFDITTQKEQEFRLKKQQASLLELTGHPSVKEGQLAEALQLITRVGRETLGVNRASVWLYEDNGKTVRCMAANYNGQHLHQQGATIDREMFPIYFRTLERDRVIAASDAQADPRTREMANQLFEPQNVSAVLDASVRQGARIVGLVSFEHAESERAWTLDEQSFATSLADTVGLVLEQKERLVTDKIKLANTQLEEKNQEILRAKAEIEDQALHLTESIKYAKRIQTNILPAKELIDQYLENYFIVYRPRDIVGGDFYWFAAVEDKRVIVVADGTGHGVPGAFLTLIGYLLLNQIVNEKGITRPADILYHLHIGVRTALKQDEEGSESRDGMDVAIVTLDSSRKTVEYAGANLPFNYFQDWELHTIKPDKYSIGGEQMEEERTFSHHEVQLKSGDAIYLYTDGFIDQLGGPEEKRFSTRRFRDLVLRTQHESMATQRALVNLEWKEWKDDREQLDDVTVFGMKLA